MPGNQYWHSTARITSGQWESRLLQACSWSYRDIQSPSIHWKGTQALKALAKKRYGEGICRLPPGTQRSEATTSIHCKAESKAGIWSQLTRKPRKDTRHPAVLVSRIHVKKSWGKYCLGMLQPGFTMWQREGGNWGQYQQTSTVLPEIQTLFAVHTLSRFRDNWEDQDNGGL